MGPQGATNILYRKELAAAENEAEERKRLEEEYRAVMLPPMLSECRLCGRSD